VATLVCAGCSTDKTENDAKPTVEYSTQHRAAVRTAVATVRQDAARIDEKIEIAGDGTTYELAVTGGFDFAGDRGRIAVDFPGGAISPGSGCAEEDGPGPRHDRQCLPVFADARVDGQGALAQARLRLDLSGLHVTVTLALSDLGKPVPVKVPKAGDTLPITRATGVLNG
jgi:hypothetical protein